ncbi:hypothetical protein EXIGLDRAFT_692824 [Exidia glandulosa HHB12029]|uniref:SnoaL-like domain-containing protein n=1 Tax=Exidia glandulosa HHB12029 TaxID=1314781 RepID=A0A165NWM0_EXIGL|nr:hypothetical protein EXIGLDRAFT_692824 [Exidia glandulosa HHB12029]
MSSSSANVQLALSMLSALGSQDFATLEKVWAPALEWQILPASLNRPPTVGREVAIEALKGIGSILKRVNVSTALDAAKAVDTVTTDGKFNFTNEYIFTVYIADGVIVKLKEFTDSAFALSFGAYLATLTPPPASA